MTIEILSDDPLIATYKNVLSDQECQSIIDYCSSRLEPGGVISNADGKIFVDYNHRSASTANLGGGAKIPNETEILDRISSLTQLDKSRFERITVIKYVKGEFFKVHQDYFIHSDNLVHTESTKIRCAAGGNRTNTLICYLNDVQEGGETYFPWLDIIVKPEAGTLVRMDYDSDSWESNIRTQHAGMQVTRGEKWIFTLWVREHPVDQVVEDYKKFEEESNIYDGICDIDYELECGPPEDVATLRISLPGNNDPMNTIVVGFTGGMDSSLLLYLIGMCNNMQSIPYKIQPVCVTSYQCTDTNKIGEDWDNVRLMAKLIQGKIGGNILNLQFISAPSNAVRSSMVNRGLHRYFKAEDIINPRHHSKSEDIPNIHRFRKYKYIYVATNSVPDDPIFNGVLIGRYNIPAPLPWNNPFVFLKKYHIVDALLKLELEYIIDKTAKCAINHTGLLDPCGFQCLERRWAFTKINKHDMAIEYFINKGH